MLDSVAYCLEAQKSSKTVGGLAKVCVCVSKHKLGYVAQIYSFDVDNSLEKSPKKFFISIPKPDMTYF